MIVQFKAVMRDIERGEARVHVETKLEGVYNPLLAPMFIAILRGMKDTNKRAFYEAMGQFAREDFDYAAEFLMGEQNND